jgi:molybdopterin/thiamine biosynthesis adenylyltransferase
VVALSPLRERVRIDTLRDRFAPDNARALAQGHALIVDGADNFATKFLVADAGRIAGVPVVQAGAVRFSGWALSAGGHAGGACLRCVFEDIPRAMPETCAALGVLGPVVGVLGALEGALALDLLVRGAPAACAFFSYDALAGRLRRARLLPRADCPLCTGRITDLDPERYLGACAA